MAPVAEARISRVPTAAENEALAARHDPTVLVLDLDVPYDVQGAIGGRGEAIGGHGRRVKDAPEPGAST